MSNPGTTLSDVRREAMDAIQQIKANTMDLKTATEIRNMLHIVIDVAKTEVELLKAIPNSVKEKLTESALKSITGTFRDRDGEITETMSQIEAAHQKPYQLSK